MTPNSKNETQTGNSSRGGSGENKSNGGNGPHSLLREETEGGKVYGNWVSTLLLLHPPSPERTKEYQEGVGHFLGHEGLRVPGRRTVLVITCSNSHSQVHQGTVMLRTTPVIFLLCLLSRLGLRLGRRSISALGPALTSVSGCRMTWKQRTSVQDYCLKSGENLKEPTLPSLRVTCSPV